MEYCWIREIDKFKDIASDWDEALAASGEDNPFLLSDFIITWWKSYLSNRKLMIFAGCDNGRVVSGMPLCITRRGFRNIIEYPGAQAANLTHYFASKAQPGFMENLFSALKNNKEWDILILSRVLESHALVSQCRSSGAEGLKCSSAPAGFDGLVDLGKGYDSVLDNLPVRLRRYLQSCRKKASLMGELKLDKISGSQGVNKLFSDFREMSRRSFRLRGTFSAFEDNRYSDFFSALLEVFDRRERLDAHRLSAGNKTLAISFGYRFGKGFKWILTAFNPDFQELRPGHILIDALIRESIARGDPYFDMYYGGESFYKQQWCNKMLPLKKVTVYRDNLANRLFIGLENGLRSNRLLMYPASKIYNFIRAKKYAAPDKVGFYQSARSAYRNRRRALGHTYNFLTNRSEKILVLAYHRVLPESGPGPLNNTVSFRAFEKQVCALAKRFPVISLSEAADQCMAGCAKAPNQIVLTFDDGYQDNHEIVFPFLKKNGFAATFFLSTEYIDSKGPLWDLEVINILQKNHSLKSVQTGRQLIGQGAFEPRLSFIFRVLGQMKPLGFTQRKAAISSMGGHIKSVDRCMTWGEVREMSQAGMEIGSHGLSHRALTRIPYLEAKEEIRRSKQVIESRIGIECRHFSFPFGGKKDYNQALIDYVKETGYKTCLLNIHGYNRVTRENFCFKRMIMEEGTNIAHI